MDQYAENKTRAVLCKTEVHLGVNTWNVKNGVKFDKNRNLYLKKRRFIILFHANQREFFDIRPNQCMPRGGESWGLIFLICSNLVWHSYLCTAHSVVVSWKTCEIEDIWSLWRKQNGRQTKISEQSTFAKEFSIEAFVRFQRFLY